MSHVFDNHLYWVTPDDVVRISQGLTATYDDRQYFQGLRETAKDPAMIAYYTAMLTRYNVHESGNHERS